MFKFNLEPRAVKNINHEAIDSELSDGFEAITSFHGVIITGSYVDTASLGKRRSHISEVFHYLYDYVSQGQLNPDHQEDDLLDALGFVVNARINGELYTGAVPTNLEYILALAFARAKIDAATGGVRFYLDALSNWFESGECELMSLAETAALAGMDEQSVRNATQVGASNYLQSEKVDNRIFIRVDIAAQWLLGRSGYIRSKPTADQIPEGHILLPVAKDGSYFNHACRQTAGFKIGPKGDERYITDFNEALENLRAMPVAFWRRPNPNGRYGIVRAVEWKVIPLSDV